MEFNLSDLRHQFGFSQAYLAKQIGVSRPTYIQIEKGKRELTVPQAEKLAGLFNMTLMDFLSGGKPQPEVDIKVVKSKKKTPIQVIRVPENNIEKFKEIFLYILSKIGAQPNIGETALYKLFYFIDFDYFEKYGKKLIGATYIKNLYGPTPVEFTKLAEQMEEKGEVIKVKSKYFQYDQKKYLPRRKADLNCITGSEKEMIDETLNRLSHMNATDLSDYSHGDAPWQITEDGQIIRYELVFERKPPYTMHNYDAEFMQAGANDVLKDLGPISQEEYDYYQSFKQK